MIAYVGQTRSRKLLSRLRELGIGECTLRGQLPPRRTPWFYDNGAFADWAAGERFDAVRFTRDMWAIANGGRAHHHFPRPDFIVLPDLVAGAMTSLELSLSWRDDPSVHYAAPLYLAVQNGMTPERIRGQLRGLGGLFVGGDLAWKLATGRDWVRLAHDHGLRCHIGRVGLPERVAWAKEIGADSIDSSFPLWTTNRLEDFAAAVGRGQAELRL